MNNEIEEFNKIIGMRLKLKRNSLGITQSQLGEKLGLTFQQIQKYEKGVNAINIVKLLKIAELLNTNIDYFIGSLNENSAAASKLIDENYIENKNTIRLLNYFSKIKNNDIKQKIINLIKELANNY